MKNLKSIIYVMLVFLHTISFSQEYSVLKKSDSIPNIKEKGLVLILPNTNSTDFYFLAQIEIESTNFNTVLDVITIGAIDFNANAYQIVKKSVTKTSIKILVDLFTVTELHILEIKNVYPTNTLYFFGNGKRAMKFRLNEKRIKLKKNEILEYGIPKNTSVSIQKGIFYGAKLRISWKRNQLLSCYSFGGLFTPGGETDNLGGISSNFQTGNIYLIELKIALLWMHLMDATVSKISE